jgi:hypothetical protein
VLIDLNDCKIRGRALEQIRRDFGRPTFVFKSYSFAQGYPVCYTADDPADLRLLTRENYIDDWITVITTLEPRYGVPFGSMVAFLHPESRHVNAQVVKPGEVVDAFRARVPGARSEAVQMDPGDSWSSDGGFVHGDIDWYTGREQRLDELAASVEPKIAAQTAAEAGVTLGYEQFYAYFHGFLHAIPPGVIQFALRRPVVFHVPSSPLPYWVLDFRRRAVYRLSEPPPDTASIVSCNEAVLGDAIEKRLLHILHGSMRLAVHLRPGGAGDDITFWALLVPWDLGYLPVSKSASARLVEVAWRRRHEWLDWTDALRDASTNGDGEGSLFERLSDRFFTTSS